ncbi:MAG: aspartate--tRNA(Asn) ligase [Candidatus Shapirobacteria bacterium]|nr:aspartate--tRNA(Asn) ligase [Candidatus Shapirobacteria bacterium]
MNRTLISNLGSHINEEVRILGWVNNIRNQKKMQFVIIRDQTGIIQAINEKTNSVEISNKIDHLTLESAVEIIGKVVSNNIAKNGFEIVIEKLIVLNLALSPLPINTDTLQEELRADWRFLYLRLNPQGLLIFQIQTAIEHAMRLFWYENHFVELHSPKLMGSPSESGAELFKVDYFNKQAYLAQSPQFYKQMAMAAGFDRIFEIGPVFRANPSFTSRHDTEFISVDCEISWIESHYDVMEWEEKWLEYVFNYIKDNFGDKIKKIFGAEVVVPTRPFPKISMKDAYQILEKAGHQLSRSEKGDLDPEEEKKLCEYIKKKYGHEFVFVTDYPTNVRPFYHMRDENDPTITKSFDLLWKGLEITTGAQREHRPDILLKQIQEKGLNLEPLKYYYNCFKYGCPPHGGYGFGLTRMLMLLLGKKNVREVTFLYRGPNRLFP